MKYLSTKTNNIILTIFIAVICSFTIINSGALENAGMGAIVLIWLPSVIALITMILYLILNIFSKKYAPYVTILGIVLNLIFALSSLWS